MFQMSNDRPYERITISYQQGTLRICLVLLLLTINDVVNLESASQSHSVDLENKDCQMATHRSTDFETGKILALKDEMLKLLGLPSKPGTTNDATPLPKQSATKFLLNVYKNITEKESEKNSDKIVKPSKFKLTESELKAIDQTDFITTFKAQWVPRIGTASPFDNKIIRFEVDGVLATDQLISAHLRLFRHRKMNSFMFYRNSTLRVSQILSNSDAEIYGTGKASVYITPKVRGWITIDLTPTLRYWMDHLGRRKELYISAYRTDPLSDMEPGVVGIVGPGGDAAHQPFIAGFFRRSESDEDRLVQPTPPSLVDHNERNEAERHTSNQTSGISCQIKKSYVSFKDLQWQDWIVVPEGYEANYCSGECSFPPNGPIGKTLHAIILTLANQTYREKVSKPCCVPTKLSAINVLYNLGNTATLAKWKGMSVQGCGCQSWV